jgi:hypothetical protein
VQFLRGLGRTYGPVGGVALGTALVTGAVLIVDQPVDGGLIVAGSVVASALVVTTAVGVAQARRMTQLRLHPGINAEDPRMCPVVRRGAIGAAVLRLLIGALSVALLFIGVLAGHEELRPGDAPRLSQRRFRRVPTARTRTPSCSFGRGGVQSARGR